MKDQSKLLRILAAALLAAVFAGSAMGTLASAAGMPLSPAGLYLAGACAAALCALAAHSGVGALAAAALLCALAGIYVPTHLDGYQAIPALMSAWSGGELDPAALAAGGAALLTTLGFLLGALCFALLYRRETVPLAILILLSTLVASHAMSLTASIPASLPGLVACAAAFSLTGAPSRDGAAARALLPAILAVCVALALLPAGRLTWKPLEDAANRVQDLFEQYFNFTRQRIAFSINEQGYDHAGETDSGVVAMLGGPADPHREPVMKVETDQPLLLRGTVRTTYTGYSWVDTTPRSRYLYYDLTRARVRDEVFGANLPGVDGAFRSADASVEFLKEGTSTLFAPVRLAKLELPLSTALYYNTAGELFLTREVAPGDGYRLTARLPVQGEALRQAAIRGESLDDPQWQPLMVACSALPEGIDNRVYALTMQLIEGATTAYDRAAAIQTYLMRDMRYSLDVDYPPLGRDFVSYFLLDSKVGYCSYYASAMAVLGRIAGLPTRYVEGYYARPDESGVATLTGEDAHAWAEVYFKGLGWIPFDATGGATGRTGRGSLGGDEDGDGESDDFPGETTPSPSPEESDAPGSDLLNEGESPEPTPTIPPQDEGQDEDEGEEDDPFPDDSGEESDGGDSGETPPDAPPESEPPQPDAPPSGRLWLILAILLILLLIALMILWVRGRLKKSDPIALSEAAPDAMGAALVLYRACLTVLAHMGQLPGSGETPEAFAARVATQQKCPEFAAFAEALTRARYGRRPLEKADVTAGRRACRKLTQGLRKGERLRYTAHRVFRGIGNLEEIP